MKNNYQDHYIMQLSGHSYTSTVELYAQCAGTVPADVFHANVETHGQRRATPL